MASAGPDRSTRLWTGDERRMIYAMLIAERCDAVLCWGLHAEKTMHDPEALIGARGNATALALPHLHPCPARVHAS